MPDVRCLQDLNLRILRHEMAWARGRRAAGALCAQPFKSHSLTTRTRQRVCDCLVCIRRTKKEVAPSGLREAADPLFLWRHAFFGDYKICVCIHAHTHTPFFFYGVSPPLSSGGRPPVPLPVPADVSAWALASESDPDPPR